MKKALFLSAALVLGLGGCASAPTASQADATAAIQAAEASAKQAASADYEWTTTGPLIKQAKAAMAKGDYAAAVTLAQKAQRQGENAVAQSQSQQGATGPRMN